MTFEDLTASEAVFVDSNTFVYHFTQEPNFGPACSRLLERIENQEILGFTSTHILTESAHRIMTAEAMAIFGWPFVGIARQMRRHPAQVAQTSAFRVAVERVLQSKTQVLTIAPALVVTVATVTQQTGLLSNDAMIVAIMQANGLTNLASNDGDFDRVPGITRYGPV